LKPCRPKWPHGKKTELNYYRLKAVGLNSAASRLKFSINLEISVGRLNPLLLNVLHDYLIGHITRTGHKVPPVPQMPPPKRSTQTLVFHQHLPRGLPLYRLSQFADRDVWRNRHKYVNMILRYMPPQYLYIPRLTYPSDQISNPLSNLTPQNRLAAFRYPYKVILQILN